MEEQGLSGRMLGDFHTRYWCFEGVINSLQAFGCYKRLHLRDSGDLGLG